MSDQGKMGQTGYDAFLFLLKKFRGLSIGALSGGAAVPLVASVANVVPPWPPGAVLMTALVELVALILVFQFLRSAARRTINKALVIVTPLLLGASALYLTLFGFLTFAVPNDGERRVRGLVCRPDIPVETAMQCPFVGTQKLHEAAYTADLIWKSWSIYLSELMLALTWLICFLLLSTLIGAFLVYQLRQPSRGSSKRENGSQKLPNSSASEMTMKASILFLAANPSDTTSLRLSEEAREIREELERAGLRDNFLLHERGAVRPKDLSRALIDLAPRYLHFSGHGGPSGAIYLEDETAKSLPVPANALRAMFRASGDHIHCVLLNACYSRAQADEILTCVPFVIGMTDKIGDKAAIAFARGFYRGIGAGRLVPNAFDIGLAEMLLYSIPEDSIPDLLQR